MRKLRKPVIVAGIAVIAAVVGIAAVKMRPQTSEVEEPVKTPGVTSTLETTNETTDPQSENTSEDPLESGNEGGSSSTVQNNNTAALTETMTFPYTSSKDSLRIETIYSYSGYYIEDGTEDEVDNVSVIEVTNIGSQTIEYAKISMSANGQDLTFEVSLLPAGSAAIVMEADKQYVDPEAAFTYGTSVIAYLDTMSMHEDEVSIINHMDGTLTVTNVSDHTIGSLKIFYKNRLETGEYVGGIAYTVKLEQLEAGKTVTIAPSHFDGDAGVVMMVRTYE